MNHPSLHAHHHEGSLLASREGLARVLEELCRPPWLDDASSWHGVVVVVVGAHEEEEAYGLLRRGPILLV